jgi:hypothetical protein
MTRRQLVRDLTAMCFVGGLAAGCSGPPEGALPKEHTQTAEERAAQEKKIEEMKTGYRGAPGIPGGAPGGGPRLPKVNLPKSN